MANRRTMRKRKKLGMWKQDTWKYYLVIRHDSGVYEFLGTVWGWNKKYARIKASRRYPNLYNIKLKNKYEVKALITGERLTNETHPKLIRDRELMEIVRMDRES